MRDRSYRTVIFDFDGTLVNTLEDLADSANHTLRQFDLPVHPVEDYKKMVGNGMENLMLRASGLSREDGRSREILAVNRAYYALHGNDKSCPYPGMVALLSLLNQKDIPVAVYSNKPQEATAALTRHFFPSIQFFAVVGAKPDVPNKPDPTGVFHLMECMQVNGQKCLFVGDSNVDMLTAKNAGCDACGVLWGFRDGRELLEAGADYLAAQPSDLLSLFERPIHATR